jgi:hypothetical protein
MGVKNDAAVASQKGNQIAKKNCDTGLDDPHTDWGNVVFHGLFLPVVFYIKKIAPCNIAERLCS